MLADLWDRVQLQYLYGRLMLGIWLSKAGMRLTRIGLRIAGGGEGGL